MNTLKFISKTEVKIMCNNADNILKMCEKEPSFYNIYSPGIIYNQSNVIITYVRSIKHIKQEAARSKRIVKNYRGIDVKYLNKGLHSIKNLRKDYYRIPKDIKHNLKSKVEKSAKILNAAKGRLSFKK